MTALVASWVLVLLTVFALSFGHQAATGVRVARWQDERDGLAAIARSGIAFSQSYLDGWLEEQAPFAEGGSDARASRRAAIAWQEDPRLRAVRVGRGHVSIGYVERTIRGERSLHGIEDENRRAPLALLDAKAIRSLEGLSPEAVRALQAMRADPERFRNLDPTAWPGLDARSRETIARVITTYARKVNVNTASVEVLVAVGMPERGARKLVERRDGPDGLRDTADDHLFVTLEDPEGGLRESGLSPDEAAALTFLVGRGYLGTESDVFRVRSRGWIDEFGPWCEIDAVLDRSSGDWEVRSWTQKRNG